uniref:Uncharacterized protein n=1 Tax=Globodera pallida TaxID=36090 RepID=A0A183BNI0_GLOPA
MQLKCRVDSCRTLKVKRTEDEAEEEAGEEAANDEVAAGDEDQGQKRGRKWKQNLKAIKMRSFMRDNSPFARDLEFLPILDEPKFRVGVITYSRRSSTFTRA